MKKFLFAFLFGVVLTFALCYFVPFFAGLARASYVDLGGSIFVAVGVGVIFGSYIFFTTLRDKGNGDAEESTGYFLGLFAGDILYRLIFQEVPAPNMATFFGIVTALFACSYFSVVYLRERLAKNMEKYRYLFKRRSSL